MRHTEEHQKSGVHCDLRVERLVRWKSFKSKSTAISCLQRKVHANFTKLLNGKMKEETVVVVAEKLC